MFICPPGLFVCPCAVSWFKQCFGSPGIPFSLSPQRCNTASRSQPSRAPLMGGGIAISDATAARHGPTSG